MTMEGAVGNVKVGLAIQGPATSTLMTGREVELDVEAIETTIVARVIGVMTVEGQTVAVTEMPIGIARMIVAAAGQITTVRLRKPPTKMTRATSSTGRRAKS